MPPQAQPPAQPLYDDVTMLDGAAATADQVRSAIDGAWLAHIAAHGIIASLMPLNDQALVPLMVDLHGHLRAGQTLAESLYRVRRALKDDPVQDATAASLVALGAA